MAESIHERGRAEAEREKAAMEEREAALELERREILRHRFVLRFYRDTMVGNASTREEWRIGEESPDPTFFREKVKPGFYGRHRMAWGFTWEGIRWRIDCELDPLTNGHCTFFVQRPLLNRLLGKGRWAFVSNAASVSRVFHG